MLSSEIKISEGLEPGDLIGELGPQTPVSENRPVESSTQASPSFGPCSTTAAR